MSKKHFVKVAAILKAEKASKRLCEALASEFAALNPNFRRTTFLEACGHGYQEAA